MGDVIRPLLSRAAHATWAGDGGFRVALVRAGLRPAEVLYRTAVAARNFGYDRGLFRIEHADVPVVSVGNLLVGGTGKTPVAAWIARLLADAGHAPALVSRGYGEDEMKLHRLWNSDVPILADPYRARAVRAAAKGGRRAIVLDDGFQHRALGRSLDLVLHPLEGPWDAAVLPRGPFREPPHSLGRADRVVLTCRTPATGPGAGARAPSGVRPGAPEPRWSVAEERLRSWAPDVPITRLGLEPGGWRGLDGRRIPVPEGPLLAVTGIARPDLLLESVRALTGRSVEAMPFPDHHEFTAADARRIRSRAAGRTVVTTEKDAVRWKDSEVEVEGELDGRSDVAILTLRVAEAESATPSSAEAKSIESRSVAALGKEILALMELGSSDSGRSIGATELRDGIAASEDGPGR